MTSRQQRCNHTTAATTTTTTTTHGPISRLGVLCTHNGSPPDAAYACTAEPSPTSTHKRSPAPEIPTQRSENVNKPTNTEGSKAKQRTSTLRAHFATCSLVSGSTTQPANRQPTNPHANTTNPKTAVHTCDGRGSLSQFDDSVERGLLCSTTTTHVVKHTYVRASVVHAQKETQQPKNWAIDDHTDRQTNKKQHQHTITDKQHPLTVSSPLPSSALLASQGTDALTTHSLLWSRNATILPSPEITGGHGHRRRCRTRRSARRRAMSIMGRGFSPLSFFFQNGNACNAPGSGTTGLRARATKEETTNAPMGRE